MDWTALLPPELKLAILDYASQPSVIAMASVSGDWRALAHTHDMFYIPLSTEYTTTVDGFDLASPPSIFPYTRVFNRLKKIVSCGMPVSLQFVIYHAVSSREAVQPLLESIRSALPFLVELIIRIPNLGTHFANISDALNFPAPRLRLFELNPTHDFHPGICQLSPTIFRGIAPCLKTLRLVDVRLPTNTVIPILAGVVDLEMSVKTYTGNEVINVHTHFPLVKKAIFVLGRRAGTGPFLKFTGTQFDELTISSLECPFNDPVLKIIPRLHWRVVDNASPTDISPIWHSLLPPFHISLEIVDPFASFQRELVAMKISSNNGARTIYRDWGYSYALGRVVRASCFERVTTMHLDSRFSSGLFRFASKFPELRELWLVVKHSYHDLIPNSDADFPESLDCPVLSALHLIPHRDAKMDLSVSEQDVARIGAALLRIQRDGAPPSVSKCALYNHGIRWRGSHNLRAIFSDIVIFLPSLMRRL